MKEINLVRELLVPRYGKFEKTSYIIPKIVDGKGNYWNGLRWKPLIKGA